MDEEVDFHLHMPDGKKFRFNNFVFDAVDGEMSTSEERAEMSTIVCYPKDARINNSNGGVQRSITNKSLDKAVSGFLKNDIKTKYKIDVRESNQLRGTNKQPFVMSSGTPFKQIDYCKNQFAFKGGAGDLCVFGLFPDSNGELKYYYGAVSDLIKENHTGIEIVKKSSTGVRTDLARMDAFNAVSIELNRRGMFDGDRFKSFQSIAYDFGTFKGDYVNNPTGSARESQVRGKMSVGRTHPSVTDSGKYFKQMAYFFDSNETKIPKYAYTQPASAQAQNNMRNRMATIVLPASTILSPGSVVTLKNPEPGAVFSAYNKSLTGDVLITSVMYNYRPSSTSNEQPASTMMIQGSIV